ncbi:MAG TPA: exo-beta-N-acetylmuramidase NamZ domain-containing protein [Methylomirabilota bacterium]|nr:exo-beta-N-acetylmuramidase NamZ domain-containing protein [Methylomirabilota bacterium]
MPVLLAVAVVLLAARPAPAQALDFTAVDDVAREAVQSGEIPGVVVLVGRGDDVLFRRAYGWRRLVPDAAPMTVDTIFDIASLTKPLGTTLAMMSLVERGKVRLDAPLGRYLSEFRKPAFTQVTIQRLLTHSAGFPAIPPPGTVTSGAVQTVRALHRLPFDYAPGSGTQYSDVGFILLGEVVRRVSGQPLDRYLDRTVFKPLGLRDTTFNPGRALLGRIAPTEYANGRMLHGEVHDPRARTLGGVAGHAGMFSSAADVARLCRMLVAGGALDKVQIFKPATVRAMWTRTADGSGSRALGWDVSSVFARSMLPFFPPESMIHTGFTGTSVMIDPQTGVYLIVLTNRVHPHGGGAAKIRELRVRVAAAVGATLFGGGTVPVAEVESTSPAADGPDAPRRAPSVEPVRTGLDVMARQNFAPLAGYSVGLVTNQTGVDAHGRRNIDLLAAAPGVRLTAIFSPEHGITGDANTDVAHGRDAVTGVPIWSLYGTVKRPTAAMLKDITLLVFDIQDVGVRYYTYLTTLVYVMEEAARQGIPVLVLDRPNPITGRYVEGPLMDPDLASFTAPHTIPVRTGMTIGEFGRMAAAERRIPVSLTVVPLEGWDRGRWHDETALPWVNPSPNIRSVTQALLYSGVGLLEATNLSVGRGTEAPFEVVGAPWIEAHGLASALNDVRLPGVTFEPIVFTPSDNVYARLPCGGVRLLVTDREAIRPVTVGLALARVLRARYRDQFKPEAIQNLLVNRSTMWAFLRGEPLPRVLAWAEMARTSFLNRRASYLIYR